MENIDLNISENRSLHNTDEYGDNQLVIRRGKAFTIKLLNVSQISALIFKTGREAKSIAGTYVRV